MEGVIGRFKDWSWKESFYSNIWLTVVCFIFSTMPKKNTWKNSKAKKLLYANIIEGQANMQPWQVYMLHPEYQEYPFQSFSANFKKLKDTIEKNHARMVADCAAFKEDLKYLSLKKDDTSDPNPKPWHHSEAKDFLKQDIKEGKHKNMAPKDLHKT